MNNRFAVRWVFAAGFIFSTFLFTSPLWAAIWPIDRSVAEFESGGQTILIEQYEPKNTSGYPAIVLLYGDDRLKDGAAYRRHAKWLAAKGYGVYIVDYFRRTDLMGTAEARSPKEYFRLWLTTIQDALSFISDNGKADPERIGLLGFSIGASLALANATQDRRVKAVVEFFGALPHEYKEKVESMPPTLILHGGVDDVIPVQAAFELSNLFKKHSIPHEMKIYTHAAHGFMGKASSPEAVDSFQRTVDFFDRNLAASE